MASQQLESSKNSVKKLGFQLGQSLVETALVLPIVLFLVLGVFELGRVVFIFSAVNNASREAARYGAATGSVGGNPRYLSCSAIRQVARETAFLSGLTDADVEIGYDTPVSGTMAGTYRCGDPNLDVSDISLGDRIVVTVTRTINPILPFLPSFRPTFVTARTILKDIVIGPVECSDGLDNDGDGFRDYAGYTDPDKGQYYPPDPGCSGPDDTTEALCYRFTLFGQPTDGGNLSYNPTFNCANRYIEGTGVALEAIPAARYTFSHWLWDRELEEDIILSTSRTYTLTMDTDKDVIAHFRLLSSDLEVTKDAPPTVLSDQALTYTISVSNPYTDTARNLVVTDTLPAGVTYLSSSAGCTPPATPDGIVVCNVPELAAGDTLPITIEVRAPIAQTGSPITLANTVTATAFEYDPNPSNNTATAVTTVEPLADLYAIAKIGPANPVYAGTEFDYTIEVENLGPSSATNVAITDPLPVGLTFVSSPDGCTHSAGVVTCAIGTMDQIGAAGRVSRTFRVQAPDEGQVLTNVATVGAKEVDNGPASNIVSTTTTITSVADLTIAKADFADPVVQSEAFSYRLTVTNNGPSTARQVEVVDNLPSGMIIVADRWTTTQGVCSTNASSTTLSCNLGNMAPGTQAIITFDVLPEAEGLFTNTAQVSSITADLGPLPNEATETTLVVAPTPTPTPTSTSTATPTTTPTPTNTLEPYPAPSTPTPTPSVGN